jgi:hypothetical protein
MNQQLFPQSIPLATRRGRSIENYVGEPTSPMLGAIRDGVIQDLMPRSAKEISGFDSSYNCMGLVFGARRVEIPPSSFGLIVEDDDYLEVNDPTVRVGDIVAYFSESNSVPEHVGIVVELPKLGATEAHGVVVLSKLGFHGEYLHPVLAVPQHFGFPRYWRVNR